MIIDARTLSDQTIKADVCIVGAGVAGLTLAHELIDSDFRVAMIESGGRHPDKSAQGLFTGDNTGHAYYPLDVARCCGIGGSSHKWLIPIPNYNLGARIHPLDEIDFQARPWVPHSGWPLGYQTLAPFYRRAHARCQAGAYTYSPDDWEVQSDAAKLDLDAERVETTVFQFVARDLFTRELLENVAKATNIALYTHVTALKLEPHPDGKQMAALRLATIEGQRFSLRAGRFVLALGALENARILLLSNEVHSCGVGNQEDQVGRYFMEHPHCWSGRLVPAAYLEPSAFGFYSLHRAGATAILGKLKLSAAAQREHQLLNYCVSIHPMVGGYRSNVLPEWPIDSWPLLRSGGLPADAPERPHTPVVETTRRPNPIGGLLRGVRRVGRHLLGPLYDRIKPKPLRFKLNHMAEQAPNPESRVTLGDSRDVFDRPRIKLNWSLGPLDVDSIIRSQQLLDLELRRSGLGKLQIDTEAHRLEDQIHGGWHHMGTTRMHRDPQWGVVDPDCRVHGTTNLYIAGPSTFPTSGYANPVLTIMALAIRLADHLKVGIRPGAP